MYPQNNKMKLGRWERTHHKSRGKEDRTKPHPSRRFLEWVLGWTFYADSRQTLLFVSHFATNPEVTKFWNENPKVLLQFLGKIQSDFPPENSQINVDNHLGAFSLLQLPNAVIRTLALPTNLTWPFSLRSHSALFLQSPLKASGTSVLIPTPCTMPCIC